MYRGYVKKIGHELMENSAGSCYQSTVDLIIPTPPMNECTILYDTKGAHSQGFIISLVLPH